jgi:hypothetical protein
MCNNNLNSDKQKSTESTESEPHTVTFDRETDEYWPPRLTAFDQWAPPVPNGKQPLAVEYSGLRSKQEIKNDPDADSDKEPNYCSWSDERVWTSHEHAFDLRESDGIERYGHGSDLIFLLQNERRHYFGPEGGDPFALIDFDDAVNIDRIRDDSGDQVEIRASIHPAAWEIVERAGFAALSSSAADQRETEAGLHCYVEGGLPDGTKTISDSLPEHPDFPGAEIEVYDGGRCIRVTRFHIPGTATDIQPAQELIDDLTDRFVFRAEGSPDPNREPDKDREAIQNVEYTTDIEDVYDGIYHTDPSDISLRSEQTEERGDGTRSYDPSWEKSESGTRLMAGEDVFYYRKGEVALDVLHVVALEERIVSDPRDHPAGAAWFEAIEALRNRGAHIPVLVRNAGDFLEAQLDGWDPTEADHKRLREHERGGNR